MADPIDFGPGRTPRLGFFYSSDSATNANWDALDRLVYALQVATGTVAPAAVAEPSPPAPAPAPKTPPTAPKTPPTT
jgi:hypothetical protein